MDLLVQPIHSLRAKRVGLSFKPVCLKGAMDVSVVHCDEQRNDKESSLLTTIVEEQVQPYVTMIISSLWFILVDLMRLE